MAKKTHTDSTSAEVEQTTRARLVIDTEHPEYQDGLIDESSEDSFATESVERQVPPLAPRLPAPERMPPVSRPVNICAPVSGRYRHTGSSPTAPSAVPTRTPTPVRSQPLKSTVVTVRVDVDRYYPQSRISIEVVRLFPRSSAHAIAEVTSDACLGLNHRRVTAAITYVDGNAALIRGDVVTFEARRTTSRRYGTYTLTLSGRGTVAQRYDLAFESVYFDRVDFEVDRTSDAASPTTSVDTTAHPNRPADLPAEVISLATVYNRAGFDVTMSPSTSVIPNTAAGTNNTWSDSEMHNAMVTYWSRYADSAQWALWVLFARRHDQGYSLGGVMFDDIGPNHRQGTAIFTDSFIQDAPAGDSAAAAWRQRMVFWTAVHEMGHAFNLAHAWQKALGVAGGGPGDPWIPLSNEPEARSFMNYPFRVAGGEASFFADFRYRFSDSELLFMRHAPRRFVQMGNSNWFVNHAFEAPRAAPGTWSLRLRPNREVSQYEFLEPVMLEFKLTNNATSPQWVDHDLLMDGRHVTLYVARGEAPARQWLPFVTQCHKSEFVALEPGTSIYGSHLVSATTSGWLIDEPGFYHLQAAVDIGDEIVMSNVLRIHVLQPASVTEDRLAPDYFIEDVARVLAFTGAPFLERATNTLRELVAQAPTSAAAAHAELALSTPLLWPYKRLEGASRGGFQVVQEGAKVEEARALQMRALVERGSAAIDTMGHIHYFGALDNLSDALLEAGDRKSASAILTTSVKSMKSRGVLANVVADAERKLTAME